MGTKHTRLLILCVTIAIELVRFIKQLVLSNTEAVIFNSHLKTQFSPYRLHYVLFVLYLVPSLLKITNGHQPDFKWEYLKKCDILRFVHRQVLHAFCLDDYIRDIHQGNLNRHELMRHEWARFVSFNNFPQAVSHAPSGLILARDGFYYTDVDTIVECFCCRQRFDASIRENTNVVHCHHSETCAFALNSSNTNVPVNGERENRSTYSNGNVERFNSSMYTTVQSRLASYHNCLIGLSGITSSLANAGFYHSGGTDSQITCFACGLRLPRRELENDPWRIHALHSPNCLHVIRTRGTDFVRSLTTEQNRCSNQATEESDGLIYMHEVQRLVQKGHDFDRVMDAIQQLRRLNGDREISAMDILEYINRTEPNLTEPNADNFLSSALRQFFMKKKEENMVTEKDRLQNELLRLQDEVVRLKREKVCKVCLEKDMCIVFLPCGHLVACDDCAPRVKKCPVCRAIIKGTARTYLS
ncbi:baculoviral IAP repeat-containing protein 2-like [Ruditapes philippinarum]|uniref:baculoviral IAP repeat-containing protein 2-like n=1 Tax=Ruditapes philippinarum TaxID=129788 RepID=UPI00295B9B46|nr:baculoviral IAP repeat-containing protein 2-like [Ruditapes philippinarum]